MSAKQLGMWGSVAGDSLTLIQPTHPTPILIGPQAQNMVCFKQRALGF